MRSTLSVNVHKTDKVLSICSATQPCKMPSCNNFYLDLYVYLYVCMYVCMYVCQMCFTAYGTYEHDSISVAETWTAAFSTQVWYGNLKPWNFTSHHCYILWCIFYSILLTLAPYHVTDCNHFHLQYFSLHILFIHILNFRFWIFASMQFYFYSNRLWDVSGWFQNIGAQDHKSIN